MENDNNNSYESKTKTPKRQSTRSKSLTPIKRNHKSTKSKNCSRYKPYKMNPINLVFEKEEIKTPERQSTLSKQISPIKRKHLYFKTKNSERYQPYPKK